jgi:hypothetical protein
MGTLQQVRPALRRLPVRAHWESAAGTVTVAADVLELSRGGAKLALDDTPDMGVVLTLHFDQPGITATCKVCWSRMGRVDGKQRVWVACSFQPALSGEFLERLKEHGYLERRQHSREPLNLPATARWPMGDPLPVRVRDFSAGGLCLMAPYAAQRGQRMLLHLGEGATDPSSALLEVQWCIPFAEGHLIGCSFMHRAGLDAIRHMAFA